VLPQPAIRAGRDLSTPPAEALSRRARDYSTFFLRRSTMIPRNRTASAAQTIRTVEVSIDFLLS
jgi:hypothetical protein